jgi:type III secretion system FlhB-like substrate exporter
LPINKNLPDIKSLTSKTNSLLSKYDSSKISSPSEFFKKTPSELKEILNASKAFSKLSNSSKKTLEKYNPSIAQFLKADSTFIQNIKESIKPGQNYQLLSDDILKNFIESVRKYNLMTQKSAIIDTELINKLIEHQIITKDEELLKIINKLKLNLNNPIPPELYEYISRM